MGVIEALRAAIGQQSAERLGCFRLGVFTHFRNFSAARLAALIDIEIFWRDEVSQRLAGGLDHNGRQIGEPGRIAISVISVHPVRRIGLPAKASQLSKHFHALR